VLSASVLQCPVLPDGAAICPVPPIVASALCIKPRGLLTSAQAEKVDSLKAASTEFAVMPALAMRFRGLLKGSDIALLDTWLSDAVSSGTHAMRQSAAMLRRDLVAIRNAILQPWSSGQTEGQINKLKALKRSMYGQAGAELLHARMLPIIA
jgi:transposase